MANELQVNGSINYTKGNASGAWAANLVASVAGVNYTDNLQPIATTDTVVTFGSIGTLGFYMLKNIDAANFVQVGFDGTTYPHKLLAGEFMIARNNGATIHAKSDTASVNIAVRGIEL